MLTVLSFFSLLQAGPLAAYYKLPLHRVLVVSVYVLIFLGATLYGDLTLLFYEFQAYDDTDLPCGVLRLQPKGGYGRHNGLVDLTVYVCHVILFICVPLFCLNPEIEIWQVCNLSVYDVRPLSWSSNLIVCYALR
jgi:hypothetical protein